MDLATLYDEDFYAWSEQQAAVLRRLGQGGVPLPNDLDLQHVVEEVEDLGKAELRAACSMVRQLFTHLMKLYAMPSDRSAQHWANEADTFRLQAKDCFSPSMAQHIDLDEVWGDALHQLVGQMRRQDTERWDRIGPLLDNFTCCPFGIGDLLLGRRHVEDLLCLMRNAP